MGFDDRFRMSVHAVITDEVGRVLLLRASYGDRGWGLPGGALEPGETVHEALVRECFEEIGAAVEIKELTGVYYHKAYDSQVLLFRCELPVETPIILSDEHTEFKFFPISDLSNIQKLRVQDCLNFDGKAISRKF